jgi:Flp pilus assembly protein TadG
MRDFFRLIDRFRKDKRGNLAVIFVFASLPLISAVGCAIDYSRATQIQSKLQAAADAASVGSVAKLSPAFVAAGTMTGDGAITAGVTDATNIFQGNMKGVTGYTLLTLTPTVTKTGIVVASNVQFTASVPTMFLGVMGKSTMNMTGISKATSSLPPYLDFYLTLDVSGSMGLPSTAAEAVRMQQLNPDNLFQYPTGCTLACHFAPQNSACVDPGNPGATQGYPTNGYCMGYAISRVSPSGFLSKLVLQSSQSSPPYLYKNPVSGSPNYNKYVQLPSSMVSGLPNSLYTALTPVSSCPTDGTDNCIQLRLDAVGYAVNQLFITANATEKVTNQFRIGLYPFIQKAYAYFALTPNISGSSTTPGTINYAAANLASQLDTNMDSNLGSGGTHIDQGMHDVNALITSVGDGSSSNNTQPFVFLVTDGAQDPQTKGTPNGSWSGSNHAVTMTDSGNSYPGICTTMKNRGIVVSVLYIPYQVINPVNASFAGDEDDYANNNIPNIPASLKSCASPNFFFTANSPADITTALNAMFNQALITAHISN